MQNDSADSEWTAFIAKLEAAAAEFVHGRPAAFQALWSRAMTLLFAAALAVWSADGKTSRIG